MMKNLHLVPVNVIDLVDKINDNSIRDSERNNYILRLESIRDYTTMCLNTYSRDKQSLFNSKKKQAK